MTGSGSAYPPGCSGAVLLRAAAVVAAVVAGTTGILALLRGAVSELRHQHEPGAAWTAMPLDLVIVALAAAALAACGLWLVAVAVATAFEAVAGASSAALRAVSPRAVRRLVLICCGIAVGSTSLLPPAMAAEHPHPGAGSSVTQDDAAALAGLPLPDRTLGEAPPPPHERPSRAAPQASARLVTVAAVEPGGVTYVVRQGDSLWAIAARFLPGADDGRLDAAWRRIHRANRDVIGPDPSLIIPGTRLRIPPRPAADHHHRKDAS